jgi:hypothetical protein
VGFNCPHCSEAIAGAMTQEAHESRLKAKGEEVRQLREALTAEQAKAQGFDSVVAERDTLRGELAAERERGTRFSAMAELGITDQKAIKGFESIYASEVAGLADDARPSFGDWLAADDGARAHPLLSGKFTGAPSSPAPSSGDDATAAGAPPPIAPGPAHPSANAGANGATPPARDPAKMSAAQLRTYLNSLSPAQAKQWKEENGARYGWT